MNSSLERVIYNQHLAQRLDHYQDVAESEAKAHLEKIMPKGGPTKVENDHGFAFNRMVRAAAIHPDVKVSEEAITEGEENSEYKLALSQTGYLNRKKFNTETISRWDQFKAACKSLKERAVSVLEKVYIKVVPLKVRIAFRKLADKISTSDHNLIKNRAAANDLKAAKKALQDRIPVMGPLYSKVHQQAKKARASEGPEGNTPYERADNRPLAGAVFSFDNDDAVDVAFAAQTTPPKKTPVEELEAKLALKNKQQLKAMLEEGTKEDQERYKANQENNQRVDFKMQGGKTAFFADTDPTKNDLLKVRKRREAALEKAEKRAKMMEELAARKSSSDADVREIQSKERARLDMLAEKSEAMDFALLNGWLDS